MATKRPGTDSGGYQLEVIISDTSGVWGAQEIMVQCSDIAGLNRSTDGGETWFTVNRGFYDEDHYGAIGFLFSKYTKGTAYYIGVGNTEGGTMYLFKSTNFDAADPDDITWSLVSTAANAANKRAGLPLTRTHSRQMVEYDDTTDHYLICATYDGYWLSVNDGTLVRRGLTGYRVTSIVDDPNNIGTEIFLTTDNSTSPGVYRVNNPFTGTKTQYRIGGGTTANLQDGMELAAVDNAGTTELVLAAHPRTSDTHGWIYHGTGDPSTAEYEAQMTWTEKTPSSGSIYTVMLWMTCDARYNGSNLEVVIGAVKEGSSSATWMGTMAVSTDFQNATPTWKNLTASASNLSDAIIGITPTLAWWWWALRGGTWTPGRGTYDCAAVRFSPNDADQIWAAGGGLCRMSDFTLTTPVWEPAVNGMTCQLARSVAVDPFDDDKMIIGTTDFTQMSTTDGWLRSLGWEDDEVGDRMNDTGLTTVYHHTDQNKVVTGREEGGVTWYTDIYEEGEGGWTEVAAHYASDPTTDTSDPVYGALYFDDDIGREVVVCFVGTVGFRRSLSQAAFTTVSTLTTASASNKIVQGAYAGGGVGYFYHPASGLFRFTNYGTSWTKIWTKTGNTPFTGYVAYDQDGSLWVMANKELWHVTDPDDGTMNSDGTNATGSAVATRINSGTFTRIGCGAAHPTEGGHFGVINDASSSADSEFWVTKDGGDNWTNEANGEFKRTGNNLTLMAACDSAGKVWFASKGNNVYPLQTTLGDTGGNAPVNTVLPVVSGTVEVGQTLSSTTGTWTGDPTIVYTYEWLRGTTPISGETSSTYQIAAADIGSTLSCRVTGTNSVGNSSATSAATITVPAVAPVNTVLPAISGTVETGQTLSTTDGTWTGTLPITYTYQWKRGGVAIPSATASTYLIVDADAGSTLSVTVTATNARSAVDATSASTTTVPYVSPTNTVLPAISGTAEVGELLSASTGTWTGTTPLIFTYKWKRGAAYIPGATAATYSVAAADIGSILYAEVTAENGGGSSSATSAGTSSVPTPESPPVEEGPAIQKTFVNYTSTVPAEWFNRFQKHLAGFLNLKVVLSGTTIVQIEAASSDGVASAYIGGQMRRVDATASHTFVAEAVGTWNVYIVATAAVDTFAVEVSETTPATSPYRRVAEVDWNGSAITALRGVRERIAMHEHDGYEQAKISHIDVVDTTTGDPHSQYVLPDASRPFTEVVSGVVPVASSDLATKGYTDGVLRTVPVGGIFYWPSTEAAPAGFILANGAAVSRSTYSKLWDRLGVTFGSGDGSTTFNLPDLRGRMVLGYPDGDFGERGGSLEHTHTQPTHTHYQDAHSHTTPAHAHTSATTGSAGAHTHDQGSTGSSPTHTHTGPAHTHAATPITLGGTGQADPGSRHAGTGDSGLYPKSDLDNASSSTSHSHGDGSLVTCDPTVFITGTSGSNSASHTHAPPSNSYAHTHQAGTVSGVSGSAGTGSTGTNSASHTHTNPTTASSGTHSHGGGDSMGATAPSTNIGGDGSTSSGGDDATGSATAPYITVDAIIRYE